MELEFRPVLLAVAAAVVIFNAVVTRALILDVGTTALQKVFQGVLIWLLPVLGGTLILYLIASHHDRAEMASLAPWPFYMTAAHCERKNPDATLSSADKVAEGACGEGSCGGD